MVVITTFAKKSIQKFLGNRIGCSKSVKNVIEQTMKAEVEQKDCES